jgi:hypothetical protein
MITLTPELMVRIWSLAGEEWPPPLRTTMTMQTLVYNEELHLGTFLVSVIKNFFTTTASSYIATQ